MEDRPKKRVKEKEKELEIRGRRRREEEHKEKNEEEGQEGGRKEQEGKEEGKCRCEPYRHFCFTPGLSSPPHAHLVPLVPPRAPFVECLFCLTVTSSSDFRCC